MDINILQQLIEQQLSLPAPLIGSVKKQYTTCGQPNCRCKAKLNPQKHGPYNQLSYSFKGRSSTMFVKDKDIQKITAMTASYKAHRELTMEIGKCMVELCRKKGVEHAQNIYDELYTAAIRKKATGRTETGRMKELRASRDKWKKRAVERGDKLKKSLATIDSLKNKTDRWHKEVLLYRKQENDKLLYIKEIAEKIKESNKISKNVSLVPGYQKINIST